MLIKPRPADEKTTVDLTVRLTRKQADILTAYAVMIGEKKDYVVGELVEKFLATDKDFLAGRKTVFPATTQVELTPTERRKIDDYLKKDRTA